MIKKMTAQAEIEKKEENLLFHILILAKCDVFLKHGFLIQLRVGIYSKISGPACS